MFRCCSRFSLAGQALLLVVVLLFALRAVANNNMFGMCTRDAALLTTMSTFHGPSGVMMQGDTDWITPLAGGRALLGVRGNPSDCDYLRRRLEATCQEHVLDFNSRGLACHSIANYCRTIIAKLMRSQPLQVAVLIVGWDERAAGPVMYWIDEVGAIQEVPYAAHGREFPFVYSVLDRAQTAARGLSRASLLGQGQGEGGGKGAGATAVGVEGSASSADTIMTGMSSSSLPSSLLLPTVVGDASEAKTGARSLRDLSAEEGLEVINACWRVINKRTSGYDYTTARGINRLVRVFGVTANGIVDYSSSPIMASSAGNRDHVDNN